MKRSPLLHAELSHVIASMGHGDMLVIGDAGLPIPDGPRRIDLAVARGVPGISDVLKAVLSEMQVESALIAREALEPLPAGTLPAWCEGQLGVVPQVISHEELKRVSARAKAVVRTGECTPYANIILVAGVAF
ncbi:D-ribose pyranase [Variovorax sp. RO1]|uniref:D-ribose pyranase n=1 Tax=Variovorax boronicumulans TaxID=436515 RepID=A0AAW8E311_9BURK|nr:MULTISPECIES: D-ribose pyranase [Variovorax]MDP9881028.1 D-ribose pyranase [Variovorax boronicumulans]MDP9926197.1 D-ribose pyranase [Variovorax boronicumulans]OEZ29124.1 ribose pyranase [Variovorax boronicumulans]PLC04455.1 D-ribose pyranase [Variovorax sp. RO1]QOF77831.1 D-ribose pyranase [Variovorax sp. 38R]